MKINGKTILSTSSTTTNYVVKQSSTTGTLINSQIFDNGTNVGIGTTSPSEKLDVNGVIRGLMPNDPLSGAVTAKFLSFSGNPFGLVFRGYASGAHSIQSQRESSDSSLFPLILQPLGGNVGIGTSSPVSLLHINNANTNPNALTVGNNNNGAIFGCTTGGNPIIGNYTGDLPIQFGYFSGGISTSFTERMRIDAGGNVGIGTTSPTARFQVGDLYRVSSDGVTNWGITGGMGVLSWDANLAIIGGLENTAVQFRANNAEVMRLTLAGNVGIGISSPDSSALLEIRSSTQGFLPPRMTTSERDNINSPANGLMIFNTDNETVDVFANGSGWRTIAYV